MRVVAVLLCMSVGFLLSCVTTRPVKSISDESILIGEGFSFVIPKVLSASDVDEDVSHLLYVLDQGYIGKMFLPRESFATAQSQLGLLRNSGVNSPMELCKRIAAILNALPDNHIFARFEGEGCSTTPKKSNNPGVGLNGATSLGKLWAVSTRAGRHGELAIISIASFPKHEDLVWSGFRDAVRRAVKNAIAVVIDMRGNGGGDDTMGRDLAHFLYGQEYMSSFESIVIQQTPAVFAMLANNSRIQIHRAKSKDVVVPEYVENRLKENLVFFSDAQSGKIPAQAVQVMPNKPFNASVAYTKPIYILVDRWCASSCESTLEAFEAHPHAVTVGENTYGAIHFGELGTTVLPHSKIVVQMGTKYWKRRDGRFFEKAGYEPKIRVPFGQDALSVVLERL